jgi:translation initiation factor 2 subunit 2
MKLFASIKCLFRRGRRYDFLKGEKVEDPCFLLSFQSIKDDFIRKETSTSDVIPNSGLPAQISKIESSGSMELPPLPQFGRIETTGLVDNPTVPAQTVETEEHGCMDNSVPAQSTGIKKTGMDLSEQIMDIESSRPLFCQRDLANLDPKTEGLVTGKCDVTPESEKTVLVGTDISVTCPENKFCISLPQVVKRGNKKTCIDNFSLLCKELGRDLRHVSSFILSELGASGVLTKDDYPSLVLSSPGRGYISHKKIEDILRLYALEYVLCHECHSPDTILKQDENKCFVLECDSWVTCGAVCSVAPIKYRKRVQRA